MKYIITLMLVYLLGAGPEFKTGEAGAVFQVSSAAQAQGLYGPPANADAVANRRMFAPSYQGPKSLTPVFPWRAVLILILVIAGILVLIMRLARMSNISQKRLVGINHMCANMVNNNVSIAPWSGFWYYLMSFVRCNVILFFSLLWFGFADVNIYTKIILWCTSFILDRIAVGKAEDVAIRTIDDFKYFFERNLAEGESDRRPRYANYFILAFCLLWLVEILIHTSTVLSTAAELYANIIIYEIAGVIYFYIVSAYLFDSRIISERLKSASARSLNIRALTWRWLLLFYAILLAITILFLHDIGAGENIDVHRLHGAGRSLNYVKYGVGFCLLAMTLTVYAATPMVFKVAAYAHYLGQKAKT